MVHRKISYIAVNLILLAFLYLSVSLNKTYIRPAWAPIPVLNVLTGSFANFMAAYVISLFPATPILTWRLSDARGLRIIIAAAVVVFIILAIEELAPIFSASKVRDGYDIIASALGSSCAVLTFVLLRKAIRRGTD